MPTRFLLAATAIGLLSTTAQAHHHETNLAQAQHDHDGKPAQPAATPSTKAFETANAKMHKDMAIKYSGDADTDFVRGMIPHHQGAIDMATIVLAHGKNPEIRKLAEEIIKAQEGEIAWMQNWLKTNAK